jgi:hypothetical protein
LIKIKLSAGNKKLYSKLAVKREAPKKKNFFLTII